MTSALSSTVKLENVELFDNKGRWEQGESIFTGKLVVKGGVVASYNFQVFPKSIN